jgi:hypothetical protein
LDEEGVTRFDVVLVEVDGALVDVDGALVEVDGVLVEVGGALVEVDVEKPFSARDSRSRRRTADAESNLEDNCVCLTSPWAANANDCHTQLSSRLLSASAVRRRERLSRAENGFSTSTSTRAPPTSTRTPSTSTRAPSTSTRAPSTSTRTTSNLVTPSSSSPRNVVSAIHVAQKASNSHNKLISQMGNLLANEEGNSSVPPSPRQSSTSRCDPDGVQTLPP